MIRFRPLTVRYHVENGELLVYLHGRDEQRKRRTVVVKGTEPHFYATEEAQHEYIERIDRWAAKSLDGRPVHRVTVKYPFHVPEVRGEFTEVLEADVLYHHRVRYDLGIRNVVKVPDKPVVQADEVLPDGLEPAIEPRVLVWDIETYSKGAVPEVKMPSDPVISISAWDSYTDRYFVILNGELKEADAQKAGAFFAEKEWRVQTVCVKNEAELFAAFASLVKQVAPDILAGWYSGEWHNDLDRQSGFDVPYIGNRARQQGWPSPNWEEYVCFDLMRAYERKHEGELDSAALDYVAQDEGLGKKVKTGHPWEMYESDRASLLIYNVNDVFLTKAVAEKQSLVPFFLELVSFAGCGLEDLWQQGKFQMGRLVDSYVFHRLKPEGIVQPSKSHNPKTKIKGATVFKPSTGVFPLVVEVDNSGEYANIIRTFNLSPETRTEAEDGCFVMPSGNRYLKEPRGVFPSIIDELLVIRQNKKDAGEEEQYRVVKEMVNCYSEDTEIVTVDGIKLLKDVKVGDRVFSINPETLECEVKPVIDTYRGRHDGEMVWIETNYVNLIVTPNHRMLLEKNGIAYFEEARDLGRGERSIPMHTPLKEGEFAGKFSLPYECWFFDADGLTVLEIIEDHPGVTRKEIMEATGLRKFRVCQILKLGLHLGLVEQDKPRGHGLAKNARLYRVSEKTLSVLDPMRTTPSREAIPRNYEMDDWLRFVGWYVTEGYTAKDSARQQITILSQKEGEYATEIRSLLKRMGLRWSECRAGTNRDVVQFTISSPTIHRWLVDNCGRGSYHKKLPKWVFSLSLDQRSILFGTLMKGDGNRRGRRYTTTSGTLKDQFVALAVGLGYKPAHVYHDGDCWRIQFGKNKGSFKPGSIHRTVNPTNHVVCVTVEDNHTVLVGRDGRFQWCGQTFYGVLASPYYRNSDPAIAADITDVARKHLDWNKRFIEQRGGEILMGDTDSCLFQFAGGRLTYEQVEQEAKKLVEELNQTLPTFVAQYGAETCYLSVKYEHTYDGFLQAGKKKRYACVFRKADGPIERNGIRYEMKVRGFEARRSSAALITKQVQKQVFERALFGDDTLEYLQCVVADLKAGCVEPNYYGVPVGLGKGTYSKSNPQHAKAAQWSNENLGTNFRKGSKPRLFFGHVRGKPATVVFALDWDDPLPKGTEINWDATIKRTILGPLKNVLDVLGIDPKQLTRPSHSLEEYS